MLTEGGLGIKRVKKQQVKEISILNKRKQDAPRSNLRPLKGAQQGLAFLKLSNKNAELKEEVMLGTSELPCKVSHSSLEL